MWFMNPANERFPMPPAANMRRVIGDEGATRFGMGGATIFNNVASLLGEMGRDIKDCGTILDWGCGAGRITRYLLSCTEARVYGADIDEDNIDWCKRNLSGEFIRVPLDPPTSLPNGFFDLVIGASVITHLTEAMQFAWLEEMHRITRPGALLFLSISGPTQFAHQGFPASLYRRVQELGFIDHTRDPALDGYIKDADYYRSTWHSRPYVMRHWARYFDVVAIADAVAALQDFVILRRREN
jgi:SAM-dependent methyltransferase